jgi:DDB1- and CUL4-associated factor 11
MMSAGWDNRNSGSVVARHEWKGLSKMNYKLEDWMEKQQAERQEPERVTSSRRRASRTSSMPGGFWDGDDDDDSDFIP